MCIGKGFALAFVGAVLLQPLYGQTGQEGGAPSPILQQYDQAIDQVAERAMQSVVEIEVTGYGPGALSFLRRRAGCKRPSESIRISPDGRRIRDREHG